MPQLELVELRANYGDVAVLERISFSVDKGEIISLIGPSGSGKSTLLRVLVGLLPPAAGSVRPRRSGSRLSQQGGGAAAALAHGDRLPAIQPVPEYERAGQCHDAPVRVKGQPPAEAEAYARQLLDRVGMGHKLDAYPDQLSGGQQQRVAIARALALKPEIVLLDEVTSALDPELVNEVLDVIRLLAADGMTIFFVSHEMAFVREVSSKVIFMADGNVVESGTPAQIFDAPQQPRPQIREQDSAALRSCGVDDVDVVASGPAGTGHGGVRAVPRRPGAELLIGAVDGHVHACPHLNGRSVDVFEAVEQAAAAGMRAIGLMDNFCSSVGYAALARRRLSHLGVEVFGGVILEPQVGGLSVEVVRAAIGVGYPDGENRHAADGARFVSLPTHHTRTVAQAEGPMRRTSPPALPSPSADRCRIRWRRFSISSRRTTSRSTLDISVPWKPFAWSSSPGRAA